MMPRGWRRWLSWLSPLDPVWLWHALLDGTWVCRCAHSADLRERRRAAELRRNWVP
jgi:hypothetical protein